MLSKKNFYKIISNGISVIIFSDKAEFNSNTGQILFYLNDELMHIAPASSTIINTHEKSLFHNLKDKLMEEINEFEDEYRKFKNEFVDRNKFLDADDKNISEHDRFSRIAFRNKREVYNNILNIINEFKIVEP